MAYAMKVKLLSIVLKIARMSFQDAIVSMMKAVNILKYFINKGFKNSFFSKIIKPKGKGGQQFHANDGFINFFGYFKNILNFKK